MQEFNNQHRGHWRACFVFLILILPLWGCAGGLANMLRDKIVYNIQVLDMQGRPVPAATIWWMLPADRSYVSPELMARLLGRYAADADFVQSTTLHPSLLVNRTDQNGRAVIQVGEGDVHGKDQVIGYFAALKRGYHPTFVQDVARPNTTRSITIKLEPEPNAQANERMLAFDLLMAPSPTGGIMSTERYEYLESVQKRMRTLALDLEREQRFDEASVVYYNLAYLPSVETIRSGNGDEVIVGYTNGYDGGKPQRRADRERAIALNHNTPEIVLDKTLLEVHAAGGLVGPKQSAMRQRFIRATEEMIRRYPERIWPMTYISVIHAYTNEGRYSEACTAFKRAFQFEPGYKSKKNWRSLLQELNNDIANKNAPCGPCLVDISK
jgi:pentatricopeptide repeat protein